MIRVLVIYFPIIFLIFADDSKVWTTNTAAENWSEDTFKTKGDVQDDTLFTWVTRYSKDAEDRAKACQPVRDEISRLQEELCKSLDLENLQFSCGWGASHFRGCLHSLQTLATHHPEEMSALQGRTLIFGSESGVSLQGKILKSPHNFFSAIFISSLFLFQATLF